MCFLSFILYAEHENHFLKIYKIQMSVIPWMLPLMYVNHSYKVPPLNRELRR